MILHNKFSNYYHPVQFTWRYAYGSGVLCTVVCKVRKRHDEIGTELIIMAANIRQRHKRTEPYEAIMSFIDQKTIRQKDTLHHSRGKDPA